MILVLFLNPLCRPQCFLHFYPHVGHFRHRGHIDMYEIVSPDIVIPFVCDSFLEFAHMFTILGKLANNFELEKVLVLLRL